jgi:hypothetical protein
VKTLQVVALSITSTSVQTRAECVLKDVPSSMQRITASAIMMTGASRHRSSAFSGSSASVQGVDDGVTVGLTYC